MVFKLLHDRFQTFLEIAAIAGPGQKCAHIQREDGGFEQNCWRRSVDDLCSEPFRDGGLANAGIADQKRVVLAAAAEHLDAALDLVVAADQRVDVPFAGLGIQVDAVFRER